MAAHPDELLADFQETYGLNVWNLCQGCEPKQAEAERLGALAWQLPRTSRLWRSIDPSGGYDSATMLLRQLEYDVRSFHWAFTEEGKSKVNEPEPLMLPGEEEAHKRAAEEADNMALEVARIFGLNI